MIIYIEVVILMNLFIHLLSVFLIHLVLYIKISKLIYFACLLDILYMLIYIYHPSYFAFIKPIFGVILIFLSFSTNFPGYLKSALLYYLFAGALGGISFILTIGGNIQYFILFIIYFIICFLSYIIFQRKSVFILYELFFCFKSKKYKLKAFLDTGCVLYYRNIPVIVLNKKYDFHIYTEDFLEIESGLMKDKRPCYYLPKIKINHIEIACYVVFLEIPYEAIIGINVL